MPSLLRAKQTFFKIFGTTKDFTDESLWVLDWFCSSNDSLLLLPVLGPAPSLLRSSSIRNQATTHFFSLIPTNFRDEHILIRDQINSFQRGISIIFFQMYIQGQSSLEYPGKNMLLWLPPRSKSSFWEKFHVNLKYDATHQKMSFESRAALAQGLLNCWLCA